MWFSYFIIGLAVYTIINGILHDIFVLRKYRGGYDRNLLRLLMDGHILITCGFIYLVAWFIFPKQFAFSLYLCLLSSVSLLIYCFMIFPFLKSVGTIFLNTAMLVLTVLQMIQPGILTH